MVFELTAEYIKAEAEKAEKSLHSRIRKACRLARETKSTVPFSLGSMIDAHVPIDTIRKVYRQGSG